MIRQIATAFHPAVLPQLLAGYPAVFLLMALGYALHFTPQRLSDACSNAVVRMPLVAKALLMILLIYLVIQMKSAQIQPFIYFQF
jgi:hypothetical protein